MSTIFGVPWSELGLEHVEAYLNEADDESLLWEAKGTKLDPKAIRRQVCAFANGHEVGYLILGADRGSAEPNAAKWKLDGVEFPGDEPGTWIAEIVGDPEGGVRPRPDFDVEAWPAANGHVAVVRVTPTSTPPCIANGTVYERLPGKTQTVRDPLILANLFSRGDEARKRAQALADRAARTVMDTLGGVAGSFRRPWTPIETEADQPADDDTTDDDTMHVRFAVGVAATGTVPNIAGRLFRDEFAQEIWTELGDRPSGLPQGLFGRPPDPVDVSQEALTWRHELVGLLDFITVVRAAWDGSAAVGQKLATEDVYPDAFAQERIAQEWRRADQLMQRLGGFGDVYVTVFVEGGRFPRRKDPVSIVMRRGPVLPGVDGEHVASLGRELMRALGNLAPEP